MRQKNSRQLFEYWNRVRDGRPAPRREEIEPSDIRQILSDTFILEVSGKMRTISYRLAGTRLCAAFGRELKGYGFLGHWAEENCFDVAKLLTQVYRDLQPMVFVMRSKTASGKQVDYEMLALPLEPMPDGTTRILGIATPDKDYYWLGTEPLTDCTLALAARHIRKLRLPTAIWRPLLRPCCRPNPDPVRNYGWKHTDSLQVGSASTRRVAHLTVHEGGKLVE